MLRRAGLALLFMLGCHGVMADNGALDETHAGLPKPRIEAAAKGGSCVADAAFMRRNHMTLLKHQRDDTLRGGLRTGSFSLKQCIGCHASQTTHRVNGEGNFCQSCHAYAAVKIDCFECHANQAAPSP